MGIKTMLAGAALAAVAVPSMAFADWWEARTDQFVVYSAGSKKDATELASLMERHDRAMRVMQGIGFEAAPSDAQRVTIFHYGDGSDIAALAGSRASGVRGFYIPRAGRPVAFSPLKSGGRRAGSRRMRNSATELDATSVMKHEYAHSFMFQHKPATYPAWYVEGFAEFYGSLAFEDDGTFHLGNPPQYRGDFIKNGPTYHVENLFETDRQLTGLDQANWYATGWLMVHYLTFDPSRQGQLGEYLQRIQKGEASMDVAKDVFGDLDQLNRDVRDYLKKPLPGANVRPPDYQAPEVAVRKLTDEEEAVIDDHMRSNAGVDESMAKKVQRNIRNSASLNTRSELVALAMAEAEFDAKDYAMAEKAAQRAVELNPSSARGHTYLGLIDAHFAEENEDMARWEAAREHFLDGAASDRADPLPLVNYYDTYMDAELAPTQQAIIALEKAYMLAPFDRSIRLKLVRQLAREGKGPLAAEILNPIVFAPHGNEDIEELRQAMTLMADNKATEGSAIIEAKFAEWKWEREQAEND